MKTARVLVFSHTTGYQLRAFNDAADALEIELVFATDRCRQLDDPWQDRAIPVRFFDVEHSLDLVVGHAGEFPADGVIAVGDRPVVLAAHAAAALGLPWHSVDGAVASTDKRRSRAAIAGAGLPSPRFTAFPVTPAGAPSCILAWPVVLKPLGLSGSRGVIRADDRVQFAAAFERIRALLARPQVRTARTGLEDEILVEEYIPGMEYALEGVLTEGALRVLAIFDKPDPLEGPYFEETIYTTPSELPEAVQQQIAQHVQRAAAALGLRHGPIHAECRVDPAGVIYVLEVAARPIGGLCSRVLTFERTREASRGERGSDGVSLESVLLQHALGRGIDGYAREPEGAAVMMIPITQRGLFKGVTGEADARRIDGVTDVRITAKPGQLLEPLPEAGSYLGFIFARGATAREAERAVRRAHECLAFSVSRELAVRVSL